MNSVMAAIAGLCVLGAEYVINVPEGQVVTNTASISAETAGDVLVKTGKGTWYKSDTIGSPNNFSRMEVREGVFENAVGTGLFLPTLVVVKAGAVLRQLSDVSYKGRNVTIQIDKGGMFDDRVKSFATLKDVTGAGTFANLQDTVKGSALANFTGDIVAGLGVNASTTLGDGADPANDPDLLHLGSIYMRGGANGTGYYPIFTFKNAAPMIITNMVGGAGSMEVKTGSSVTFSNLCMNGSMSRLIVAGVMTNVNGRISLKTDNNYFKLDAAGARYVQIGGVLHGLWPAASGYVDNSLLKRPDGSMLGITSGSGYGVRILEGGAELWTKFQQPYRTEVNSGSTLVFCGAGIQASAAPSTSDPIEFKFDGGALRVERDAAGSLGMNYPAGYRPRFVVGPRGMTISATGQETAVCSIDFLEGVEFTDNGSCGPLNLLGSVDYTFNAPPDIGGTVTIDASTVHIANNAAFKAEGASPILGTGDIVLNQGRIYSYLPKGSTTRIAAAPGKKLRIVGSVSMYMSDNNGADWQIGPLDSQTSAIEYGKGSALFFENQGSKTASVDFFKNGKGTCVVVGGLPLGTNGKLPVLPVFVQDYTTSMSGDTAFGGVDFLTYGESGIVRFESYVTNSIGGSATDVPLITQNYNLSQDATVAALHVGASKSLTIRSGYTLTVGDGTGTACVLMDTGNVKGPGTLNFGTSEGVVTTSKRSTTLSANITGSGGLSVVGTLLTDVNACGLILSGNNTYSGGTRISSHRVKVQSDTAFGTGDVYALGGEGNGGQIMFDNGITKVTLTNNLHLSGFGQLRGSTNDTKGKTRMGAIWASSPAELTGAVELAGKTRVMVEGQSTELRFSGVISGDSMQMFNWAASITNAGTVVYEAVNTYTGRTDVIRSTLVLEPGASAGTGEIVLDGGRLVLKAGEGGVNLPNVLRGAGTVVLDGRPYAPTTFAAGPKDDPFFQQEHELDANGRNRVVNSLAGFTSVTNSGSRVAHLSVTDDAEGSFKGEVSENVVIHYGMAWAPGMLIRVY